MFFIMGISNGKKELAHQQMVICSCCGAYGRYAVFMTYTALSLFFIPCLKWNRQYYVQMTCCSTLYRLDPEIGKRIRRGEDVEIRPEHLQAVGQESARFKRCTGCGYTTAEDFEYCPKCGRRL